MRIGIVGGGINGLAVALELAQAGYEITLFERGELLAETSSSSSKLLHGGLRYLEQGNLRLVREALRERERWIADAPQFAHPLELILPIYRHSTRNRWIVKLGLLLYDALAGKSSMPKHRWLNANDLGKRDADLVRDGLIGGFSFFDGQMDEIALGQWVVQKNREQGVTLREHSGVSVVGLNGELCLSSGDKLNFDYVINATGPWAEKLLKSSGHEVKFNMDLVRGSHLIVDRVHSVAFILEVPNEKRIFFVLPWQGKTLVGTTEVRQTEPDHKGPEKFEIEYLMNAYNAHFRSALTSEDIISTFAGVRPLVYSKKNPSATARDAVIEKRGKLINVLGGKWTTARALAKNVRESIERP
jgi:glycerol-3-phosphate dehydrogenase